MEPPVLVSCKSLKSLSLFCKVAFSTENYVAFLTENYVAFFGLKFMLDFGLKPTNGRTNLPRCSLRI